MRIIEWNCQGAFRKKNKEILELGPDILIVPECEPEDKLQFGRLTPQPNDFLWYSDTGKKGVGIFSYSSYKLRLLKEFNPEYRYVIPVEVSDGTNSFLLFAIWAMDNIQNPMARYIAQVWLAVNYYQSALRENSILIGDFNSNQIWDGAGAVRLANHTDVVNFLNDLNIHSLYHKQFNEAQGKESLKTFFMHRNLEKAYHIDYAFASQNIIKSGFSLSLEHSGSWIGKSDHVPVILDIPLVESNVTIKDTYLNFAFRHLSHLAELTKGKFQTEISALENLANEFDNGLASKEEVAKLIGNIQALKQIDKLTLSIRQNDCA